jgi:hypothetical protein
MKTLLSIFIICLSLAAQGQRPESAAASTNISAGLDTVSINNGTFITYTYEGDLCIDVRGGVITLVYYRQIASITGRGDTLTWRKDPISVNLRISENQQQFAMFANPQIVQAVSAFLRTQIDSVDFGQIKLGR